MNKINRFIKILKKQDNKSPGWFIQVFSICASLLIALWAILLTIEMDKFDSKISLLEEIVIKLDSTNNNLILSQKQNDTIIKELYKQNQTQNFQLTSIIKTYNLSRNEALFKNQKTWLEYEKLIVVFRENVYNNIIFNKSEFLKMSKTDRKEILSVLSNQIENILLNPVVYGDSNNYSKWLFFYKAWFKSLEYSMCNYTIYDNVNKVYNDDTVTSGEIYLNRAFDNFQLKFNEFENEISPSTLEWQKKYLNIQ
jgi:hypothetical protein